MELIRIYEDNEIKKKDLDYEEILNTVIDTIKSDSIKVLDYDVSSSENIIELNASIKQINCDWTYKLYCCYKLDKDNVDYDIYLNLINSNEEFRPSDASELSNLLQNIEEIMNV